MKTFIYIALFASFYSFAQQHSDFLLTKDSDTTFLKYRSNENIDLRSFPVEYAFRLQRNCSMIELRKSDSTYYGYITYFVHDVEKTQKGKLFQQIFSLNKETVREMFRLIDSLEIVKIPSDIYIENWKKGFDGTTYIIQQKIQNTFSFKSYWSPYSQVDIPEAILIQKFVDKIFDMANSKAYYDTFNRNIPFLIWTCNGVSISKVMTKRENRKYRRKKKSATHNNVL